MTNPGRQANKPNSVAGAMSADEMVRFGDITADWLEANCPEVYSAIKSAGAPAVEEAAASADDVAAIFGTGNDALCFKAMREKWTASKCRDEAKKSNDSTIAALTKERDDLKKRLDAVAASGAAPVAGETPAPKKPADPSAIFANAEGKDPKADWSASEPLREYWKNNGGQGAFTRFAKECQRAGASYLDRCFD